MQTKLGKGYKGMGMNGPVAGWYARNTGKDLEPFRQEARDAAAELPSGSRVLEVAPGPGYWSVELAKKGSYQIVGLDISESLVKIATDNARKAGVDVEFRRGNASAMPFDSSSFDFIYCRAAFKNFSEPIAALDEMYRVLKPGGKAVIVDLRKDTPIGEINSAVDQMRLGWINSRLTKWIFKHVLLKRAYPQDEFRRMVAQTPFGTCRIKTASIGMEVTLSK
jgi:ubiquinone/menaquinone biosynthesis C-methylase UbiE